MSGFRDQPNTRARGRFGEEAAARWLAAKGFRIVARNVTTKAGEIDVVAEEGDTLCFIEVKARASTAYGPAIEAVTPAKQRRLIRAAALFLSQQPKERFCRFDVLGMDRGANGWRFTLIRDAFDGS